MDPGRLSFELAANELCDAAFRLDEKGNILWVNRAAATATGRTQESLVTLALQDILTPRSVEVVESALRSEPAGAPPVLLEWDIVRPDLSPLKLEVSLSRFPGADAHTLVAIGRDVSAR